jgi:hypothetical protein
MFRFRAMSNAVEIWIYKKVVKPAVVLGSEMWGVTEMGMRKLGYRDTWTGGRARNMENNN